MIDDERLSRLLRDLPREEASPHFTAAVLRRVRQPRRTAPLRRLAWAGAAAATLAAALWTGVLVRNELTTRGDQKARLTALENEKRALESEVVELQRLVREARETQSFVVLDSTSDYDVVVDLAQLARVHGETRTPTWQQGEERP